MSSDFIATAAARVSVRPVRHAYVVPAGDAKAVRYAIGYASSEWGGYAQPIVEVRRDGRIPWTADAAVTFVRPEVMADYGAVGDHGRRLAERFGAAHVSRQSLELNPWGIHQLSVLPERGLAGSTLFIPRANASLAELAAVGPILFDGQRELWERTGARVTPVSDDLDLLDAQLGIPSPLLVGREQIHVTQHSAWMGAGPVLVYLGAMSTRRVVEFWNMRALTIHGPWPDGTEVIWLPAPALDDARILERLRERAVRSWTTPDLLIFGGDDATTRARLEAGGFAESPGSKSTSTIALGQPQRDLAVRPLTFRVNSAHPFVWLRGERLYGKRADIPVTVARPVTTLQFDSPVSFHRPFGGYVKLNVADVPALSWPARDVVAKLMVDGWTWDPEGPGGRYQPSQRFSLRVNVPTATDVVGAILGAEGWTWSASDKGRLGMSLLDLTGPAFDVLADPIAQAVCRALARMTTRKAEQLLRRMARRGTVPDATLEAAAAALADVPTPWKRLTELNAGRKSDLLPVIDRMLGAGLLLRAFRFRCPSCGVTSHVPFGEVCDEVARCSGCRRSAVLTGPNSEEPVIEYALNTLLDRAIDQDVVDQVHTMRWAERTLGTVWSMPGADIVHPTHGQRELDLLGVSRSELVVAEVKASSRSFGLPFVRDLGKLALAIQADHLVLGSGGDWDPDQRARVEAAAKKVGIKVTTITVAEMRPV